MSIIKEIIRRHSGTFNSNNIGCNVDSLIAKKKKQLDIEISKLLMYRNKYVVTNVSKSLFDLFHHNFVTNALETLIETTIMIS